MKTTLNAFIAIVALTLATATSSFAADKEAKTRTITGTGLCAKCNLKETAECQNAIQVEKNGKKTTYYLADNKVSQDFHKNVCKTSAKVKATGTVKKVDGKMQLTATEIEVVKD
jgi:hypothetical protein